MTILQGEPCGKIARRQVQHVPTLYNIIVGRIIVGRALEIARNENPDSIFNLEYKLSAIVNADHKGWEGNEIRPTTP